MIKYFICFLACAFTLSLHAQQADTVKPRPRFQFGGEARFQYFWFHNEDWGEAPDDPDGYVLSRFLAHAAYASKKGFGARVDLQSSLAGGKIDPSPVDQNPLDLHQAYIEQNFRINPGRSLKIVAGRQGLVYGASRLVSLREGPNNRQAFDAIRAIYQSKAVRSDLLYSHYVTTREDIFDDGFDRDTRFWGSYTVFDKIPFLHHLDVYYLGLWKREATFDEGTGREERHSAGARAWKQSDAGFQYDVEAVYQWGRFGEGNISAWTASVNASWKFPKAAFLSQAGFKTELISGDRKYDDNHLNTFNPLFPRGAYFGLAALIGPANLVDIHPFLSFRFAKRFEWGVDYDVFWRMEKNDGIYRPNVRLIYSGKSGESTHIGRQLGTSLDFAASEQLAFTAEFTWFDAGKYLQQAGPGKDILMAAGTVTYRFGR